MCVPLPSSPSPLKPHAQIPPGGALTSGDVDGAGAGVGAACRVAGGASDGLVEAIGEAGTDGVDSVVGVVEGSAGAFESDEPGATEGSFDASRGGCFGPVEADADNSGLGECETTTSNEGAGEMCVSFRPCPGVAHAETITRSPTQTPP